MSTVYQITPEGQVNPLPNTFQGISDGVDGPFDFVHVHPHIGLYIHDEGLINGSRFNLVASMLAGQALYGNAVLTHGETDDEGDTLPPTKEVVNIATNLANLWAMVVANNNGQDVTPKSDADRVPAPVITGFDNDDDLFKAMGWDEPDSDVSDPIHNGRHVCSLCGTTFTGFGNNPEPLYPFEARCCDDCNQTKVIPARMGRTFSVEDGAHRTEGI